MLAITWVCNIIFQYIGAFRNILQYFFYNTLFQSHKSFVNKSVLPPHVLWISFTPFINPFVVSSAFMTMQRATLFHYQNSHFQLLISYIKFYKACAFRNPFVRKESERCKSIELFDPILYNFNIFHLQ